MGRRRHRHRHRTLQECHLQQLRHGLLLQRQLMYQLSDRLKQSAGRHNLVQMPSELPPQGRRRRVLVRCLHSGCDQTRGRHRSGWCRDDVRRLIGIVTSFADSR